MVTPEFEEGIKERIYKAMKNLIDGFFDWPSNQLNPSDADTRLEVQNNIVIILLRFLIFLFSEGRGLIDIETASSNHHHGFNHLKDEVCKGKYKSTKSNTLWQAVKHLFNFMNNGCETPDISKKNNSLLPFSCELFDPLKYPNLEKWEIGDLYLSETIDLISRKWNQTSKLLGFTDYSIVNVQFLGYIYENLIGLELKSNESGELYLATEKSVRKSTGSFYTPPKIVEMIVRDALEPVIQEKLKMANETNHASSEAILSIKVLDNTMGSGYFLVEATEYLSLKFYKALQEDINSGRINEFSSHSLNWAKKEILSHCIYGVDLNDTAVELSKVALWLTASNKRIGSSFFDHGIKRGNSLIGTIFDDSDMSAFMMQNIEKFEDFKVSTDHARLKLIADMKTAFNYGNLIDKDDHARLSSRIMNCSTEELSKLKKNDLIIRVRQFSKENQFFHWQLEFPEVFFGIDKLGKPRTGFDVIIGNPPWASIRGKHSAPVFNDKDIIYLENTFPGNTYMPNVFEYFILQSLKLLSKDGRHSYIIPDRLGFNESLEYLRKIMLNNYSINSLTYKIPFPGVIVDTLIYSITKKKSLNNYKIEVREFGNDIVEIERKTYQNAEYTSFQFFKNKEIFDAIKVIDAADTIKLEEVARVSGGFGGKSKLITKTRMNEHQIETVKGINIGRYSINGKYYFLFKKDNITGRTTDKSKLGAIPKVLLRKTGKLVHAAYDDSGIYPEQSLYFLHDFKGDYSPFYLLSIINSSLFKFYYIEKLVTNRDTIPQLKKIHLDHFPIRKISFTTNKIEKDDILTSLKNIHDHYLQNGVITDFEEIINDCLTGDTSSSKPIEKCDVIHDFLVFLAKKMTEFNEINSKSKVIIKKINLTDKLIDYFIFKLYCINTDKKNVILEALKMRGL